MLTSAQLIKQISVTIGKAKVLELTKILRSEQFALHDLVDITFHPNKDIAFRAAWILENVFLENPARYNNEPAYIIQRFLDVQYPSCQRHYAKIIMHITSPKAPQSIKAELQKINLEPVIERLFEWMIDPKIKIAVKVFASESLFNMRDSYEWITEELANQIQYLMRDGTAAIQTRGKKLLGLLRE
jgi:hypothetical protein